MRIEQGQPTIVFVTACTRDRRPWLATESCHALLRNVWLNAAHWLVGRYVIMPDHIHLFVAPGETETDLQAWMAYWKSHFTKRHKDPSHTWQKSHWDTRMRSQRTYEEKWEYVYTNPVRHGLVSDPDDWPYQGQLHDLPW